MEQAVVIMRGGERLLPRIAADAAVGRCGERERLHGGGGLRLPHHVHPHQLRELCGAQRAQPSRGAKGIVWAVALKLRLHAV